MCVSHVWVCIICLIIIICLKTYVRNHMSTIICVDHMVVICVTWVLVLICVYHMCVNHMCVSYGCIIYLVIIFLKSYECKLTHNSLLTTYMIHIYIWYTHMTHIYDTHIWHTYMIHIYVFILRSPRGIFNFLKPSGWYFLVTAIASLLWMTAHGVLCLVSDEFAELFRYSANCRVVCPTS